MENNQQKKSIFKQVVHQNDNSGELKMQFTIDLTSYDTSEMQGYKEGSPVYKGFTCKLATLKPMKQHPRGRIDIDPSNEEVRQAIMKMYQNYDKIAGVSK